MADEKAVEAKALLDRIAALEAALFAQQAENASLRAQWERDVSRIRGEHEDQIAAWKQVGANVARVLRCCCCSSCAHQ